MYIVPPRNFTSIGLMKFVALKICFGSSLRWAMKSLVRPVRGFTRATL